jgi:pimeloyl-ACP methyl ester carboxylesterase
MKLLLGICAALAAACFGLYASYRAHDLESRDLNDSVRQSAQGQFVGIPEGYVHYELKGPENARTIVLVHGFSVPYYLWDPTFDALVAGGYRVLRYDLFGRGLSDRPDVTYDGNLFDRQLIETLDTLHITGRVDVIGSSMGGPIVATFGCRHPERVRTMAFFDPGYSHGQPMPFKLRTPLLGEYFMAVDLAPGLPEGQKSDFKHPERFPDWPDRYRPQMQYKGFRRALLSTLRNYVIADWSKDFACIARGTAPVFLVWGKGDLDVPFAVSDEVRAAIPRADFLAIDDAAHVPFIEHPEIVQPALDRFLSAHQ